MEENEQIEQYLKNFNNSLREEILIFLTNSNLDKIQKLEMIKLIYKVYVDALNEAYVSNLKPEY